MRLMIGEFTIPVYELNNRRVIKVGKCGDNFGEVQCLLTKECFTTYGFNLLRKIDEIKVSCHPVSDLSG